MGRAYRKAGSITRLASGNASSESDVPFLGVGKLYAVSLACNRLGDICVFHSIRRAVMNIGTLGELASAAGDACNSYGGPNQKSKGSGSN